MRYLRWLGFALIIIGFGLSFTDRKYLMLASLALGIACAFLVRRQEHA
jgi:hypothetical protein